MRVMKESVGKLVLGGRERGGRWEGNGREGGGEGEGGGRGR